MIEEGLNKVKKTGIETIKLVWEFFSDEIPHVLSNWRFVPRAMMLLYCYAFYNTMTWFMALPAPNNAQAGFVSVASDETAGDFDVILLDANGTVTGGQDGNRIHLVCTSAGKWHTDTTLSTTGTPASVAPVAGAVA